MKKFVSHSALFVALLVSPVGIFGSNTKFFHRADPYEHEPRYERNCLTTAKLQVMGGQAKKSYDVSKKTVNPLDLYGLHKIGHLGTVDIGDPGSSLFNFDLANMLALGSVAVDGGVGVKYAGKHTFIEANLYFAQNLCGGWFIDVNVPVKKL